MSDYMRNRPTREETDGFFCRFTFGQFFALLVLEVFTLFFIFYLGAKYGQEFLGLKEVITADNITLEEKKVLTTSDPEAQEMAKQLIAKAKTPELKDRIRRMMDNAQEKNTADLPKVIEKNGNKSSATEVITPETNSKRYPEDVNIARNKKTDTTKNTSAVIRMKSSENARYSVQVGSYSSMDEASQKVATWKNKGYPAYMMIADIPDRGRWYRVRMGGFQTRGDASKYLQELQSRESVEALVVLNEQ